MDDLNEEMEKETKIQEVEERDNRKLHQDNAYSTTKLKFIQDEYKYEDPVIDMKTEVYGNIIEANVKANETMATYGRDVKEFVQKVKDIKMEKDYDRDI